MPSGENGTPLLCIRLSHCVAKKPKEITDDSPVTIQFSVLPPKKTHPPHVIKLRELHDNPEGTLNNAMKLAISYVLVTERWEGDKN